MTVMTVDKTHEGIGSQIISIFREGASSDTANITISVGRSCVNQSVKMFAVHPGTGSLVEIDPAQAWFWTRDWLDGELEAENDILVGDYEEFSSIDDFVASL